MLAKEEKSFTAKAAMPAKEKKSLTAKAAVDAKGPIFEPTQKRNAKTAPSTEWPHPRRRRTLVHLLVYHPVAITSLGAVLADLGLNLLCSLRVLGGKAFLRLALRAPRPPR